jgi:choline kinase
LLENAKPYGEPMKAIILSAGQGSRLLPLTEKKPKCLLPAGKKTLIEWQIDHLVKAGVKEFVVVVGFYAHDVEALLKKINYPGVTIRTLFNPFYKVADNLGSCWLARPEMNQDFMIVNGDTLFEVEIPRRLLTGPKADITVTVDSKDTYDADDMKVKRQGSRLLEIGKTLPLDQVNAESIGMLLFRGQGVQDFSQQVDESMRQAEGLKWWYLRVIGLIAQKKTVETCLIKGCNGVRWISRLIWRR